jgi:RNA polymerase sigma-70 factor (ECF subfamily)
VITRNRAIDRLRKMHRRSDLIARLTNEPNEPTVTPPSSAAASAETAALIRTALTSLPANQRLAIELAFFGGLSQSEIAEQLKQPLGTVKARIRRGMITMRDALEGLL